MSKQKWGLTPHWSSDPRWGMRALADVEMEEAEWFGVGDEIEGRGKRKPDLDEYDLMLRPERSRRRRRRNKHFLDKWSDE